MKPEDFKEPWVKIAELDSEGKIVFTKEYLNIMGELGWEAKAFAAHLITHWADEYEHTLDRESDEENEDKGIDVVDYWGKHWSQAKWPETLQERMSADWYTDILRAKLLTIALPKRLLIEYRDKCLEKERKLLNHFEMRER